MRQQAKWVFAFIVMMIATVAFSKPDAWFVYMPLLLVTMVGVNDFRQTRHAIRRNFPVVGHFRYLFESIRPEINQYFVESNTDGMPFSREMRSLVYQRAKNQSDTVPFGTKHDVYAPGYECLRHSLFPSAVDPQTLRVRIGGKRCVQPYDASIFMISAMSFGALSSRAVESLNAGAKIGRFAHNSGEGGISAYHLRHGGDLIWQIGTGYFGCRNQDGSFDPVAFESMARREQIKMIEIKLSQGAKPSMGGLLPAEKVTAEIAAARGVPLGVEVVSPSRHKAFSNVNEMLAFVDRLRKLSGGKPVGIKLCVGIESELEMLCQAIVKTDLAPDFITVDGAEGGTGAAPLEFTNHVGQPLTEGLVAINQALIKHGLKQQIRVICSGKIATGFDILRQVALGADICASARGMMLALGCIQALRCNSNRCPAGVATQDPYLVEGLAVGDKSVRVASYHKKTLDAVAHLLSAMGLTHTAQVTAEHIFRRNENGKFQTLAAIYQNPPPTNWLLETPAKLEKTEIFG